MIIILHPMLKLVETFSDPFWWPGASLTAHPPLQTSKVNTELSLYDEVTRDLINFCPRLSCAVSFCKAHGMSIFLFT